MENNNKPESKNADNGLINNPDIEQDADALPENNPPLSDEEISGNADNITKAKDKVLLQHQEPSAKQIAKIISQNELIEKAKLERIRALLEKQIRIYERKTEICERLEKEMVLLKKKQKVAKAALKKAREVKSGKPVIELIKTDLSYIAEAKIRCKEMKRAEKKDLDRIGSLINLLDSAI
jgi:hypothetical protein